jgi:hypothetical protein
MTRWYIASGVRKIAASSGILSPANDPAGAFRIFRCANVVSPFLSLDSAAKQKIEHTDFATHASLLYVTKML